MTLDDYLGVVKRRKWSLILPAVLVLAIAAAVALLLPPIYKSSATILIEEQDVPTDFVMTTVTGYAEQRLQTINQRVMSATRLQEIINQYGLYQKDRDKKTIEEIISAMREDISLAPLSAETVDRRTGRTTTVTIAFTLSYEANETPEKVQQVTNVLASLFLEGNIQVRERQAKETSLFLEDEVNKIKEEMASLDQKIAVFKEKNINALPELLQVSLQTLNNAETNQDRLNEQLKSFREREGYLQSQLANIPRNLEDLTISQDQRRLEELTLQLDALKVRFSDQHPDVIKLRAELAEVKERAEAEKKEAETKDLPDNPAYVTLAAQLASVVAEIDFMKNQLTENSKRIAEYRRRMESTPGVEEQYRALTGERNNLQAKHDDLSRKLMEAKLAQGLEKGQKAERFTLIDPPRLPEKPDKPNRLAVVLIGLVLGIGAGVGTVSLAEFSDRSVRVPENMCDFVTAPVLAVIPEIVSTMDLARKKRHRLAAIIGIFLVVTAGLVAFHFLVMDFSVLGAKLSRRLGI